MKRKPIGKLKVAWNTARILGRIRGALINANVTLNTVSDSAQVPASLARQARRDAVALSGVIVLLKGDVNASE